MRIGISGVFVAILVMGLLFTTLYSMVGSMADDNAYALNVDDSYKTTFDATTNISSQINEDYNKVFSDDWSVDLTSFLGLSAHAVSLVKNMIKLPFQILDDVIVDGLLGHLGLDENMQGFLTALICVAIIFALIALILRYRYV